MHVVAASPVAGRDEPVVQDAVTTGVRMPPRPVGLDDQALLVEAEVDPPGRTGELLERHLS